MAGCQPPQMGAAMRVEIRRGAAPTYWDVYTDQCLPYDVNVYLNTAPVVGPAGPVGVGEVVGPVGLVPVGPGPLARAR